MKLPKKRIWQAVSGTEFDLGIHIKRALKASKYLEASRRVKTEGTRRVYLVLARDTAKSARVWLDRYYKGKRRDQEDASYLRK